MTKKTKHADYSTAAKHLLCGMAQKNLDIAAVLDKAGISENCLNSDDAMVDYGDFLALLKAVNRFTDDEFFALSPNRCKPGSYAMMVRTGLQSSTLQAFIEHCCEFYYLLTDDVSFSMAVAEERATVTVTLPASDFDPHQLLADYWLLHLYLSFSWVCGLRIPLLNLNSMLAEEPSAERLIYYISPDWQVQQTSHNFCFHSKYLQLPIVKTQADLNAHLASDKARLPVWPSDKLTVTAQVKGLLSQGLKTPQGCNNIDQIATQLHTTARSLRRNLKVEGSRFQQLLDNCRRDYAIELLGEQHCNVAEVAERLGFSEPRSFSRAFKQWTGSAPSHYQLKP